MRAVYFFAVAVLVCVSPVFAARISPPPLSDVFSRGYGVVAATVVSSQPVDHGLQVHFKAEKVIAKPVAGGDLPLVDGAELDVKLSTGYGAELEFWGRGEESVLHAGDKCILTLKYDVPSRAYSQIGGSGSVRVVKAFEPDEFYSIAAIRDLAAAEPNERLKLARLDWVSPHASTELRHTCCRVMATVAEPGTPVNQRKAVLDFLHEQWRAVTIAQNYWDIEDLDQTLQKVDPAPTSDERVDTWIKLIFSPIEGEETSPSGMNTRWNTYFFRLVDLGLNNPDKIEPRIVKEMNDEHWPMQFRVGLACALQKMYQQAETEHADWNVELQKFYPIAFAESDGWPLRLLPSSITYGEKPPEYSIKRKFVAQQPTWDAMNQALARMQALAARDPKDPNASSAVQVLKEAIKAHQP